MPRTLCLWSAAALLLGALVLGNPLLPRTSASAASAVPAGSPAIGMTPVAAPARPVGDTLVLQPAAWREGAPGRVSPAAVALAVHGGGAVLAPECPDPAVAPFVVAIERNDEHGVVYVLRDGRRMVAGRSPLAPALVELTPEPPR
jgi:hypothetical protein